MIRLMIFLILMILIVPITMAYGVFSDFKPSIEYTVISIFMSVFVSFIILHLPLPSIFADVNQGKLIESKIILFYGLKLFSIALLIWLIFGFAGARAVNSIIGIEHSTVLTPVVHQVDYGKGFCLQQVQVDTGRYYWLSPHYCASLDHEFSDYYIVAEGVNSVLGFDIKEIHFDGTAITLVN